MNLMCRRVAVSSLVVLMGAATAMADILEDFNRLLARMKRDGL